MDCIDVSIILPLHNAEKWLDECLQSVFSQQFEGRLELSVYNDASRDRSIAILESWIPKLKDAKISVILSTGENSEPKGVGYAKNRAVEQSNGQYLCFLDADDVMHNNRIQRQYEISCENNHALIGCRFHRIPTGSTERFTKWANCLSNKQLYTQIYTSHGPTLIMPTWFCHREVFDRVGGFSEVGKGFPEDLVFFFAHLRSGGTLFRVDDDLLMYRYHPEATTFSVHENTIWDIRISEIESNVLSKWTHFTIWNAGKQGRKFYRSLNSSNRKKVTAFCDVDQKKINQGIYIYEESKEVPKPTVPIVHFSQASKPFIICVKLDLTGGRFEENLASLKLTEGYDYYHFN